MTRNQSDGIQDQIRVKVRRTKEAKHEDLFVRVAVTPMNGAPAVFGRTHREGCDRHVKVAEVVFRRMEEFVLFNEYNPYAARMPNVFKVDATAFRELRQS